MAVSGVLYPVIVYPPQIDDACVIGDVFGFILIRWARCVSGNLPWAADSLGRIAKICSKRLTDCQQPIRRTEHSYKTIQGRFCFRIMCR
jgi:hypothetical protein